MVNSGKTPGADVKADLEEDLEVDLEADLNAHFETFQPGLADFEVHVEADLIADFAKGFFFGKKHAPRGGCFLAGAIEAFGSDFLTAGQPDAQKKLQKLNQLSKMIKIQARNEPSPTFVSSYQNSQTSPKMHVQTKNRFLLVWVSRG